MKRWTSLALLVGMGLLVAGCKTAPPAERVAMITQEQTGAIDYDLTWVTNLDVPAADDLSHAVILGDKLITVRQPSRLVSATSLRDGSLLWITQVADTHDRLFKPFQFQDRIYINSEYALYALDAENGRVVDRNSLKWAVATGAAQSGPLAIFGSVGGRVFAHDVFSGFPRWEYQLAAGIRVAPLADERGVLVTDARGSIALFSDTSGELQWRTRAFEGVVASPQINRLAVLVPSLDHSLYALIPATGRDRWIYRTTQPLTEPARLMGSAVFLPLPGRGLVSIDPISGQEMWRSDVQGSPVRVDGDQLLLHYPRGLRMVELDSGKLSGELMTGTRLSFVIPHGEQGLLLVSPRGRIVRADRIPED